MCKVSCIYHRREKMWRDCHLVPGMRAPHLALEVVAGDLGPNPGAMDSQLQPPSPWPRCWCWGALT